MVVTMHNRLGIVGLLSGRDDTEVSNSGRNNTKVSNSGNDTEVNYEIITCKDIT